MKVLLFGSLADAVGKSTIETKEVKDSDSLKQYLLSEFPSLNNYRFQLAVNKEKVSNNITLNANDEIALLPPFAGG